MRKKSLFYSLMERLTDSAKRVSLPWVPSPEFITTKVEEFFA